MFYIHISVMEHVILANLNLFIISFVTNLIHFLFHLNAQQIHSLLFIINELLDYFILIKKISFFYQILVFPLIF